MNSYLIVGALLLFAGAVAFAFKQGIKQGSAEGDKKLEAAEDASRKALREKAIQGQGIQEDVHTMPIEDVKAELKRRAGK